MHFSNFDMSQEQYNLILEQYNIIFLPPLFVVYVIVTISTAEKTTSSMLVL